MEIDTNDIIHVKQAEINNSDCFMIYNYHNLDCRGYVRAISFNELCEAIAKQFAKDGVIPGRDE